MMRLEADTLKTLVRSIKAEWHSDPDGLSDLDGFGCTPMLIMDDQYRDVWRVDLVLVTFGVVIENGFTADIVYINNKMRGTPDYSRLLQTIYKYNIKPYDIPYLLRWSASKFDFSDSVSIRNCLYELFKADVDEAIYVGS